MAYTKMFVFEPQDLARLLTHYTDGLVPLDAEVRNVGVNPYLNRFIGLEIASKEWDTSEPLHLRYEGKKVMSWSKGDKVEHPLWTESPDAPKRQ